jgi:hypothetical protein
VDSPLPEILTEPWVFADPTSVAAWSGGIEYLFLQVARAAKLAENSVSTLELRDEAWDEPALVSGCPSCRKPPRTTSLRTLTAIALAGPVPSRVAVR